MTCLSCCRPRGDEEQASTSAPETKSTKTTRVQPVSNNGAPVAAKGDTTSSKTSTNGQPAASRAASLFPGRGNRVHPDPAARTSNASNPGSNPSDAKKKRSGKRTTSGNGRSSWWEDQCAQGQLSDRFTLARTIGKGAYSTVTEGIHRSTGERFAIKVIKLKGDTKEDLAKQRDKILSEVYLTYNLRHKNLLHLEEFYVEPKKIIMVLELMRGGSLFDDVLERGGYSEADARCIFRQILSALDYMHNTDVIHRDIKLENLLLEWPNDLESVKIADLGFAVQLRGGPASRRTMAGTPAYLAPEMIMCMQRQLSLDQVLTGALDMWAAGVALYLLLGGYPPFEGTTSKELFTRILRNDPEFDAPLWSKVSEEAQDLICSLLVKNPSNRITASEALDHPWFTTKIEGAPVAPSAANSTKSLGTSEGGEKGDPAAFEGLKRYISLSRVDALASKDDPLARRSSKKMELTARDRTSSFIKPSYFLDLQNRHRDSWGSGLDRSLRRIFSRNRQRPSMPSRTAKPASASTGLYEGATRSSYFDPEEFGLDGDPTQLEQEVQSAYQANKERNPKATDADSSGIDGETAASAADRPSMGPASSVPSVASEVTAPMPRSAFNEVELAESVPMRDTAANGAAPAVRRIESHRSWMQQSLSRRSIAVPGEEREDPPVKAMKSMHMSQHFGVDASVEDMEEADEVPANEESLGPDDGDEVAPERRTPSRAPSHFMGSRALHLLAPDQCVDVGAEAPPVPTVGQPSPDPSRPPAPQDRPPVAPSDRRVSAPLVGLGQALSTDARRAANPVRSAKSVRWGAASVQEEADPAAPAPAEGPSRQEGPAAPEPDTGAVTAEPSSMSEARQAEIDVSLRSLPSLPEAQSSEGRDLGSAGTGRGAQSHGPFPAAGGLVLTTQLTKSKERELYGSLEHSELPL